VNWKMCYHAIKKFYKQTCELDPRKFAKCRPFRQVLPGFSVCSHMRTDGIEVFLVYTLEANNSCELKVVIC
jgi:hypothetical protein